MKFRKLLKPSDIFFAPNQECAQRFVAQLSPGEFCVSYFSAILSQIVARYVRAIMQNERVDGMESQGCSN